MATKNTSIDEPSLASQLRTQGLVRTATLNEYWRARETDSALLEMLSRLLKAADAPSINLDIEDALAELEGTRFFSVQHFLCELIPLLDVDQLEILKFASRLVDAGGTDMAAGAPSIALGEWTKRAPNRPQGIYETARSGEEHALRHLSTVLRVNVDVQESLIFVRTGEHEAKLSAIRALGAMELGDQYEEALLTILQAMHNDDEAITLRCLEAGYRAADRRKTPAPADFDKALDHYLFTHKPAAIHLAANLLWMHLEGLSENAVESCLNSITHVDPKNAGTISHIDHAAYQLVTNGHSGRVARLLSNLIERSEGRITLDSFDSTFHALERDGPDTLGHTVLCWLLDGGRHIHSSVASRISSIGKDSAPFSIAASSLPESPSDQIFICRKSIGWFYIDPLAAITIPLAVLKDGSREVANEVLSLIYDPLLLSYDSAIVKHLEAYIADGHPNSAGLIEILAKKDSLKSGMDGIEQLVEMQPSERQRETERIYWQDEAERGSEQASRKSILDELFTKQYLLYGNSSLTPVYAADGTNKLTRTEMTSFSISSELPALNIVDPIGIDYMLIQFRLEEREVK